MMTIVYVLLAIFLMLVGGRMAGLWASNQVVEGVLLMLAGLFLLVSQLLGKL